MAPRTPPSFFKILLDPSAPQLPLPPDFVSKRLKNKIPKNPVIRSANGGYLWRLKIKKIGESYCFTERWSDVVKDIQLSFGDFLVFNLVDKSSFKLLIYSPNGCEKVLPPKIKVEDDGSVDNDVVDLVDDDDDELDDDDDDELVDDDDGLVDAVEDDEEEEDGDDDEDEDEDEDVCVDDVVVDDDGDEEEEEEDDDDDDGGIDGDDPYFMSTISATHKYMLRLPAKFMELVGIEEEGTITVKNDDGEEWELGLRMEKLTHSNRFCISAGWPAFRRNNNLSDGDKCLFKYITSEGKLCLAKVTNKRKPARQTEPAGETPASQVVKRNRERPVDIPASEVVNKTRGRPRPWREIPATEVVKRKSGRIRSSGEVPASEAVKRKLRRPQPPVEIPAAEVVKRRRGRSAREHGGDVDVKSKDECAEVVKRPRGRPHKRQRGRPRQQ